MSTGSSFTTTMKKPGSLMFGSLHSLPGTDSSIVDGQDPHNIAIAKQATPPDQRTSSTRSKGDEGLTRRAASACVSLFSSTDGLLTICGGLNQVQVEQRREDGNNINARIAKAHHLVDDDDSITLEVGNLSPDYDDEKE